MKMMLMVPLLLAFVVPVAARAGGHAAEAAVKAQAKEPKTLAAGRYTAKVKALLCEACGPKVVETMKGMPGVADVSVDQKASSVRFSVKKGAKVDVASLQKKLKAASDEMGMGADYSLHGIKAAGK